VYKDLDAMKILTSWGSSVYFMQVRQVHVVCFNCVDGGSATGCGLTYAQRRFAAWHVYWWELCVIHQRARAESP
jgi:hypothetical protein